MNKMVICRNIIVLIGIINNFIIIISAYKKKYDLSKNKAVNTSNKMYIILIISNVFLFTLYGFLRNLS